MNLGLRANDGSGRTIAPSRLVAMSELGVGLEIAAALVSRPLLRSLPRGDRSVLVLPGFMSGDAATVSLRRDLRRLGHTVRGWKLGYNVGPSGHIVDGLSSRLTTIAHASGRSVDLIGWSLGGVFARYLAHIHPDLVNSIITMGTPVRSAGSRRGVASRLFDTVSGMHDGDMGDFDTDSPLTVPLTSIWTKTDGVVAWRSAMANDDGEVENIAVPGTHLGLGFNPIVTHIVADRLSQRSGEWAPYSLPQTGGPSPLSWLATPTNP